MSKEKQVKFAIEKKLSESTMSEYDDNLRDRLETCVSTLLNECNVTMETIRLRMNALDLIISELRNATTSMTSIPKPLKYLRPFFNSLKAVHTSLKIDKNHPDFSQTLLLKARLADLLSVLSMTMGDCENLESLRYKLSGMRDYELLIQLGTCKQIEKMNIKCWGHEYVRTLAGEIGQEYNRKILSGADPEIDTHFQLLMDIVDVILPFLISNNAEVEAVDLLIEIQRLHKLHCVKGIDEKNYARICYYLIRTADFIPDPDDQMDILFTAYHLFSTQKQYYDALRVLLRMDKEDMISEIFRSCKDPTMKKQMCLLMGRHRLYYILENTNEDTCCLNDIISNSHLSNHFLKLAQDLDITDAKSPEDIFKSHLSETGGFVRRRIPDGSNIDHKLLNIASTYVNAMVNTGFGQDKLLTPNGDWTNKHKNYEMMIAVASLGSISLWNVTDGLTQIDKYLYSSDEYAIAGAALAIGVLCNGIRNDVDPAFVLLTERLKSDSSIIKCAASTGLGIAYAGSRREDLTELLLQLFDSSVTSNMNMADTSIIGLALGMINVGKCDEIAGCTIVQTLMEANTDELDHSHVRYLCLSLGLLYLGKNEKADAMLEVVATINHRMGKYAEIVLKTCAFAGSGNVLKVQEMLHHCTEHLADYAEHQAAAIIGIALITFGEDVGSKMVLRTFDHLLHYCELPIKRAVPLAMTLLNISNPDLIVIDQLSRLSHDSDSGISQNAILGLGLSSAGTNNSRVAVLLRQLSEFYIKDTDHMFCIRVAQGLLHLGKGLLTLNPVHSDGMLINKPALASILVILHSCIDIKSTLLDKYHYLLFYLTCATNHRGLITVNDNLSWKPVTVRVGQAVETVGQAGKPKSITGFQTHTTPVVLGSRERVELATEEVISSSSVLEGLVILKDNPNFTLDTVDEY